MVTRTVESFGGIDIFVDNAGLARDMRITKMYEEDWDIVLDVILRAAFQCNAPKPSCPSSLSDLKHWLDID